jgi:hypothetical protein
MVLETLLWLYIIGSIPAITTPMNWRGYFYICFLSNCFKSIIYIYIFYVKLINANISQEYFDWQQIYNNVYFCLRRTSLFHFHLLGLFCELTRKVLTEWQYKICYKYQSQLTEKSKIKTTLHVIIKDYILF